MHVHIYIYTVHSAAVCMSVLQCMGWDTCGIVARELWLYQNSRLYAVNISKTASLNYHPFSIWLGSKYKHVLVCLYVDIDTKECFLVP